MATAKQHGAANWEDYLKNQIDKMAMLELSKLKVRAKKKGIPQEAIEAAVAVDDEDDAKHVLIRLLVNDFLSKSTVTFPTLLSPRRTCKPLSSFSCTICSGCIRPPGHEGPCMDGQCNEMFPPQPKAASETSPLVTVAEQKAQNKAVQEKVMLKVAEKVAAEEAEQQKFLEAQKKAAEEESWAKAVEEARQKALVEEARKAAEIEAFRKKTAEIQESRLRAAEEARQRTTEIMEARRRVAEEAPTQRWTEQATWKAAEEYMVQKMEAEAKRKTEEVEAQRKEAEAQEKIERLRKAVEEQARQKIEEHARQRKEEEAAEMAAMDERCVRTFLECVKPCDWRPKIRTPIKGTILYTKFMRPCRAAGTSVDVKDSSFRCLGNFLDFLEKEGLLQLKPGETDPVVMAIRANACRAYKYTPRPGTPAKVVHGDEVLPSVSGSQCFHLPR